MCAGLWPRFQRGCLLPLLFKGKSMMRLALTAIASLGISAATVALETANAQPYRRFALHKPIPRKPIRPKAAARFVARALRALFRLPIRTVRKPPAVEALATIEPSRTGERSHDWPQHRGQPGSGQIGGDVAMCPLCAISD